MIDKNAIQEIVGLAESGFKTVPIKHPSSRGRDRWQYVGPDGKIIPDTFTQNPRDIECFSISGLADVVKDYATDPEMSDKQIRIGISESGVCVTLDERGDRSDEIRFSFVRDESYKTLLDYPEGITQSELVWLIRSQFPDRVDPTFLPVIRELKFGAIANGGSSVKQGNETVDLTVEASVGTNSGSGGPIPEEVTFQTAVFEHMHTEFDLGGTVEGVYQDVKCAVRVNVQDRSFTIKPLPGQLERAKKDTFAHALEYLERVFSDSSNVMIFVDSVFKS